MFTGSVSHLQNSVNNLQDHCENMPGGSSSASGVQRIPLQGGACVRTCRAVPVQHMELSTFHFRVGTCVRACWAFSVQHSVQHMVLREQQGVGNARASARGNIWFSVQVRFGMVALEPHQFSTCRGGLFPQSITGPTVLHLRSSFLQY